MDYTRAKFSDCILSDIFPDSEFYMTPSLPKLEVKRNKVKYKITDLRFLNERAVNTFVQIMLEAMNTLDIEEVSFDVTGIEESDLNLISDIVSSIQVESSKGGKNGFRHYDTHFLINGGTYRKLKDNTEIYTFGLIKDHAKYLYEYAKGKEAVNYFDAIIYVADRSHEEMMKQIEERGLWQ